MRSVLPSRLWLQLGAPALFGSPSRATIPQPPFDVCGGRQAPGGAGFVPQGAAARPDFGTVPFHSRSNQASCETTPVSVLGAVSDVAFCAAPSDEMTTRSPPL